VADTVTLSFSERHFVWLMIGASVALHFAPWLVIKVKDHAEWQAPPKRPRVQMMPATPLSRENGRQLQYVISEFMDPSLSSLPSARGFSQKMWARGVDIGPITGEWQIEPAFLDVTRPGEFQSLLPQPSVWQSLQGAARKMSPESETAAPVNGGEPAVVVTSSVFRADGALAGRAIVGMPALPTIQNATPLRSTRLRVAVEPAGMVRFVVLERSSGNEAADSRAVELARQVRFEPLADAGLEGEALMWGVMKCFWATELPAALPGGVTP
jgi:TonB family protein